MICFSVFGEFRAFISFSAGTCRGLALRRPPSRQRPPMKQYFSLRGAKRGLLPAAFALLLWICWAVGYWQGLMGAETQSLFLFSL